MTIDLNLLPIIVTFAVIAAVALVTVVAVAADIAVRNRPVRLARHETLTHYYGHLALGH